MKEVKVIDFYVDEVAFNKKLTKQEWEAGCNPSKTSYFVYFKIHINDYPEDRIKTTAKLAFLLDRQLTPSLEYYKYDLGDEWISFYLGEYDSKGDVEKAKNNLKVYKY